jgi:hypothetical protein
MTIREFVNEVQHRLDVLGLPVSSGWMPQEENLRPLHADGRTIEDCVNIYKYRVGRYEEWVRHREAEERAVARTLALTKKRDQRDKEP